jgi:hypothetical protein
MDSVLAVDDGGGPEPQHRRVVYGNIVYAYANKEGVIYNDGENLSNHHLTFENHRGEWHKICETVKTCKKDIPIHWGIVIRTFRITRSPKP